MMYTYKQLYNSIHKHNCFVNIKHKYKNRLSADVAFFRSSQTRICKHYKQCRVLHEKLKKHRKNDQILTSGKHFTVENERPSYPSTMRECGGSKVLLNLKFFSSPEPKYD